MYEDLPDDFKNHYYSNLLWETYNYRKVTKLLGKDNECKRSRDNLFIDIYEFTPVFRPDGVRPPTFGKFGPAKIKVRYDTLIKNYYVGQTRFLHYEDVLKYLWKHT